MKTFSFRAEAAADLKGFQQACAAAGILVELKDNSVLHSRGDVEVEIQSLATLDELRNAMRQVVDGQVMLQTLRGCPLFDNTLERDYDLT